MQAENVWLAVAVAAVAGLLIGIAFGRRGGSRRSAARVRELQERLAVAEDDMARYRTQVSGHFTETSRLLHDLTLQYRSVYEHLADGARTLCPDSATLLAPSLAEAALPEKATAALAGDDGSQLDLELDRGAWSDARATDGADALDPILDEPLDELDAARAGEADRR